MDNSFHELHTCHLHVSKLFIIINRFHGIIHSIAIAFLVYYRASFFFQETRLTPTKPWLLIFVSELLLSFIWLLGQAYRWRPISRNVFPERLPADDKLPSIDVFICTADPKKEPTVDVMSTVLSAMALDYPAKKLHVYLSDDGGAAITLFGMREAWKFAKWWLPFCRRYGIKTRCPEAYFSGTETEHNNNYSSAEFMEDREKIQEKYDNFKECITRAKENGLLQDDHIGNSRDHPSVIEVIKEDFNEAVLEKQVQMPLLVYVSREKKPSHHHHFKAGAVNVLLRVSGMISNSPYILVLDCDHYCNDPTSARKAMCFHLDPKISPSLAFVQFPQKFHNISENDIYDSEIRSIFRLIWHGLDGLRGPTLCGTNFYIKRESLYGSSMQNVTDLKELEDSFGKSIEFIKSLHMGYNPNSRINVGENYSSSLVEVMQVLASSTYEDHTKWGTEVGFLYHSVLEDYFTAFMLHCKGWTSVYLNPSRPQFLGTSPTSLNDLLVQNTRWMSGLVEVALSRFCPLIYGPSRMSFLQSMCYSELAFFPLLYCLPLLCFATIPQLCLLNDIPLYPEVPNPFFFVFSFIFISSLFKHLYEVLITGGSIRIMINEQRIWMIKSVTSNIYGSLDATMNRLGMREASFLPTNKVVDNELAKRYQMGLFDFQTSTMFLVPLVTTIILNATAFIGGIIRMMLVGSCDRFFIQVFLSLYILVMGYPIIEGMIMRTDKGSVGLSVTLLSFIFSMILLASGYVVLMH